MPLQGLRRLRHNTVYHHSSKLQRTRNGTCLVDWRRKVRYHISAGLWGGQNRGFDWVLAKIEPNWLFYSLLYIGRRTELPSNNESIGGKGLTTHSVNTNSPTSTISTTTNSNSVSRNSSTRHKTKESVDFDYTQHPLDSTQDDSQQGKSVYYYYGNRHIPASNEKQRKPTGSSTGAGIPRNNEGILALDGKVISPPTYRLSLSVIFCIVLLM
jgi:hypothetical protein